MTNSVINEFQRAWNEAVHQEAVNMCIEVKQNFYFLTDEEQAVYLDRARTTLRNYLASQGMV